MEDSPGRVGNEPVRAGILLSRSWRGYLRDMIGRADAMRVLGGTGCSHVEVTQQLHGGPLLPLRSALAR
jgi:hypothetical protein